MTSPLLSSLYEDNTFCFYFFCLFDGLHIVVLATHYQLCLADTSGSAQGLLSARYGARVSHMQSKCLILSPCPQDQNMPGFALLYPEANVER